MSCGIDCRCSSDPALLWLWLWLLATAPIRPLAWEPLYAALEKAKRQKKKKKKKERKQVVQEFRGVVGCIGFGFRLYEVVNSVSPS